MPAPHLSSLFRVPAAPISASLRIGRPSVLGVFGVAAVGSVWQWLAVLLAATDRQTDRH